MTHKTHVYINSSQLNLAVTFKFSHKMPKSLREILCVTVENIIFIEPQLIIQRIQTWGSIMSQYGAVFTS